MGFNLVRFDGWGPARLWKMRPLGACGVPSAGLVLPVLCAFGVPSAASGAAGSAGAAGPGAGAGAGAGAGDGAGLRSVFVFVFVPTHRMQRTNVKAGNRQQSG